MKLSGAIVRCPNCACVNDVDLTSFPDDFAEFVATCAADTGCGEPFAVRVHATAVVDVAHIVYPKPAGTA